MISLENHTNLVKYNDLYELARAFLPDEEFSEHCSEASEKRITLNWNGNDFLAELIYISGKPGISVISPAYNEIHRDLAASQRVAAKKTLYSLLHTLTGKNLPWGILTGIRPVKVAADLYDKGITEKELIDILTSEYFIDRDKAELALQVCRIQEKYIRRFQEDTYSLYISIPFCPSKCLYCSFPSLPAEKYSTKMESYIEVLLHELEEISLMMNNWRIEAVYVGGGTPTALPKKIMRLLLSKIIELFPKTCELTVEAGRPDTIDLEYLQIFRDHGVDRISINPQSMRNDTLKTIGRKHTAEDISDTFLTAKRVGIPIVNMDLIVGLPGETPDDVAYSLEMIGKLNPDNLTVHTLSVKKGSNLISSMPSFRLPEARSIEEMLGIARKYTKIKGMVPYYLYRQKQILGNLENVGYSMPENPCIYNIAIMEEKQTIMAAGMGAVTKLYEKKSKNLERIPNFKDFNEYMKRVDELLDRKKASIKAIETNWS